MSQTKTVSIESMTMTMHTVTQAAELTGKSRKTIYRKISEGQLSCTIQGDGKKYIDKAELIRVFGEIKDNENVKVPKKTQEETKELYQARKEIEQLKALLDERSDRLKEKDQFINHLQRLLEHKEPKETGLNRILNAVADRISKK